MAGSEAVEGWEVVIWAEGGLAEGVLEGAGSEAEDSAEVAIFYYQLFEIREWIYVCEYISNTPSNETRQLLHCNSPSVAG